MAERLTRERRRELTRDALVSAAAEVFARRGFEGASLEEIAATAGFTRGAIYANFANKEDLYFAVHERFNAKALAAFDSIVVSDGVEPRDVASIAETWWPLFKADRTVRILGREFSAYAARHPELRERIAAHREHTVDMIAAYIREHAGDRGLGEHDPRLLAKIFIAVSDGVEQSADLDPEAPLVLETIFRLLLTALAPPPA